MSKKRKSDDQIVEETDAAILAMGLSEIELDLIARVATDAAKEITARAQPGRAPLLQKGLAYAYASFVSQMAGFEKIGIPKASTR